MEKQGLVKRWSDVQINRWLDGKMEYMDVDKKMKGQMEGWMEYAEEMGGGEIKE